MDTKQTFDQLIGLITRYIAQQESDRLKSGDLSELSMKQILYMETIATLGEPTFGDLARQFGVSKPSVTAIVDRLIQGGYLQRVRSEADRRVFHVHLTEKGRQLSTAHHEIHAKIARHMSEALSEAELDQFAHLLEKISRSIQF
jgi:DNA-binding MarR family transcriptional regulator